MSPDGPAVARTLGAILLAALIALLLPASGSAQERLVPIDCEGVRGFAPECDRSPNAEQNDGIVISPDGAHVYVAVGGADTVQVYERTPAGMLSADSCVSNSASGCGFALGLDGVRDLALSPDGNSLYTISFRDRAISWFSRDPATGRLTYSGCLGPPAVGCSQIDTRMIDTGGVAAIEVSPSGEHVYAAQGPLTEYPRDPVTGALSAAGSECYSDDEAFGGCGRAGLGGRVIWEIAISPDGNGLITAASTGSEFGSDDALALYTRVGGVMTFRSCAADSDSSSDAASCGPADGLGGVRSVAFSPDGSSAYSAAFASSPTDGDNAIGVYDVDIPTGKISFVSCLQDAVDGHDTCPGQIGLDGASAVVVPPSGDSLFVGSKFSEALLRYDRAPDGGIELADCLTYAVSGCTPAGLPPIPDPPGVSFGGQIVDLAVSPDESSIHLSTFDTLSVLSVAQLEDGSPGETDGHSLKARRKQKVRGKEFALVAKLKASEYVTVAAQAKLGKLRKGKRSSTSAKLGFKPLTTTVSSGKQVKLRIEAKRKTTRKLRRKLGKGARATATIKVELTDISGNTSRERAKVKLR